MTPDVLRRRRRGSRLLLVASTGGHLAQLHELADRIPGATREERTWVTFDTPQSRALLGGEDVRWVGFTAPRDWRNVLRNVLEADRLTGEPAYGRVISTGAGIALSFLPLARAKGLEAIYIESAARSAGPSMTGRILQRVPGLELATQYPLWARDRWTFAGSVFDAFVPARPDPARGPVRRVLVTLGTIPYPFGRLVERMRAIVPADVEVVWQTGATDPAPFGVDGHANLPGGTFAAAVAAADAVVAHAGTGSALSALRAGRCPVLVPREAAHGEHVDDHQRQIADELGRRGLALRRSVDELDWDAVSAAGGRRVATVRVPPQLELGTG